MRTTIAATALLILCTSSVSAADWPNWRGPSHDGISPETGMKTAWSSNPPILWESRIGSAFSGISCVGDRLYTCGTNDKQQTLLCLNADTGETIWQFPFEPEYRERQGGDGTRGTPTIDGNRVYVQGADGRLVCCDAETGKLLWDRKFTAKPQWGYSGSVLIEGELGLLIGGNADGPLVAFDKLTGQVKWNLGSEPVGYSTPLPFELEGKRYVAAFLGKKMHVVDVAAGRDVWNMVWETSWDVNAATPIYHDGRLFFSSGYKVGSILVKLSPSGGKLSSEAVWQGKSIRAKFQTPVLYEGHMYVSDEQGLRCVEFATGTEKWAKRGETNGTLVIAQGNLFLLTEGGRLQIAPATPSGYEPTTDVAILEGRCWTVPTLYRGRLYARNFDKIVCLNLMP